MNRFSRLARSVGVFLFIVAVSFGTAWSQTSKKTEKTDEQIKQEIIRASIAGYSGNCPCPYNTDRAGRQCGRRSAYSRPGGGAPLCYPSDVTQKMVDAYRKKQKK